MSNTNSRYIEGELIKGNLSILPGFCLEDGDGSMQVAGAVFTNNIYEYIDGDPVNVNGTLFYTDGTFGNVIITSTTPGLNDSTGSLIIYGGSSILGNSKNFGTLLINNTTISTNVCSGAFIVSGGVGIKENLNIGGNINALGSVSFYNTQSSISSSIGSLVSFGGISIQNTDNSSSFTSGGGLTVAGGVSIAKDLYVNGTISSNFLNAESGQFNYITVGNLYTNLFSVANLSSTFSTFANVYSNVATIANTVLINSSISSLFVTTENVTNSSISNLNAHTLLSNYGTFDFMTVGSIYVTNELGYNDIVTNISTSNINSTFGTFGNLFVNNITSNNLVSSLINVTSTIQSYNSNLASVTLAGGLSINCNVNSSSGTEGGALTIAGGASIKKDVYISGILDMNNNVITNVTSPSLDLQVANKWYVDNRTAGTVYGNFTQFQVIIGSTMGSVTGYPSLIYDNITLSVLSTENSTSLTNGGSLYVAGGASINKNVYIGQNAHILGYLDMNNQNITSLAIPTTAYDAANKYYVDITIANGFTTANIYVSGTTVLPTSILTHSTIIGTTHSYNSSTGSMILLNGGLSINDTYNSSSATFGGAFTVAGGAAFGSDIYAQGITYFKNTMDSISTTSGSVLVSGGLGVKANISGNAIILPSIIPPIYNNIVNNTSQFYIDTNDNLFKSVTTTSGTLTTYQPTNTKGDLLTHNGITQVRLPLGANGQLLSVNSNTVDGIQWTSGILPISGINTSLQIYLSGNDNSTSSVIIEKPQGAFIDCLYPLIKNGASANFFFTKSFSSQYGHIIINNINRSSDNGFILAEYNPYQGIELYKTTNGSNGLFIQNNNQLFLGTTIQLTSTNLTTTNFVSTYGAYFISISAQNNGPAATFIITKSDPLLNSCQITKISSSPGTNNCNLYIQWYSSSPFSIYKTTNDNDDYYTIVDNFPKINVFTISLTGTNTVYLEKPTFNFYEKKSFFIKITYNTTNGPCSIFSMSKNNHTVSGNKTTYQSPGKNTLEKIIFNWDSNSLPSISKTGVNYNGIYNVEISVF